MSLFKYFLPLCVECRLCEVLEVQTIDPQSCQMEKQFRSYSHNKRVCATVLPPQFLLVQMRNWTISHQRASCSSLKQKILDSITTWLDYLLRSLTLLLKSTSAGYSHFVFALEVLGIIIINIFACVIYRCIIIIFHVILDSITHS